VSIYHQPPQYPLLTTTTTNQPTYTAAEVDRLVAHRAAEITRVAIAAHLNRFSDLVDDLVRGAREEV